MRYYSYLSIFLITTILIFYLNQTLLKNRIHISIVFLIVLKFLFLTTLKRQEKTNIKIANPNFIMKNLFQQTIFIQLFILG